MVVNNLVCPSCGHLIGLEGDGDHGVNYCRGLFLLPFIAANPGLSGWELAQLSGLPYASAVRGTQKLRDGQAALVEPEERDQGGIRFRYYPVEAAAITRFRAAHDVATGGSTQPSLLVKRVEGT